MKHELSLHEGSVLMNTPLRSSSATANSRSRSNSSVGDGSSGSSSGGARARGIPTLDATDTLLHTLASTIKGRATDSGAPAEDKTFYFENEAFETFLDDDTNAMISPMEKNLLREVGINVISEIFEMAKGNLRLFRDEMKENLPDSFANNLLLSKLFTFLKMDKNRNS